MFVATRLPTKTKSEAIASSPIPQFDSIPDALAALKAGQVIVVVDDEDRENEGDLVCAAQFATPETLNFMATEARGLICLAMTGDRLDRLQLPLMVDNNTDIHQTAFTVSIDAAPHLGIATGSSASDRARTIAVAIDPATQPDDLRYPGHVFPLRAQAGGVLQRRGHTEAAVDLARLAGLHPAGVICEIQNPDGSMARLPELFAYARSHQLKIVKIADLIRYRWQKERLVVRQAIANLPTEFGNFQIYAYRNTLDNSEVVAIVKGDPQQFDRQSILVKIHSECFTGDVLASKRCDCRQELHAALQQIEAEGRGVVVYSRSPGIGLIHQIDTCSRQNRGLKSDVRLDLSGAIVQILQDLGVKNFR